MVGLLLIMEYLPDLPEIHLGYSGGLWALLWGGSIPPNYLWGL